jgi:hypothetical protein
MQHAIQAAKATPASARRRVGLVSAAALAFGILATGALPASAATATAAHVGAAATVAQPPSGNGWILYNGWYPTEYECRAVGLRLSMSGQAGTYKCIQMNRGSYFTWALWLFE